MSNGWVKRMTAHNFKEGIDYEIITVKNVRNSKRGPKCKDWLITMDNAKVNWDYQILHNKNVKQDWVMTMDKAKKNKDYLIITTMVIIPEK